VYPATTHTPVGAQSDRKQSTEHNIRLGIYLYNNNNNNNNTCTSDSGYNIVIYSSCESARCNLYIMCYPTRAIRVFSLRESFARLTYLWRRIIVVRAHLYRPYRITLCIHGRRLFAQQLYKHTGRARDRFFCGREILLAPVGHAAINPIKLIGQKKKKK